MTAPFLLAIDTATTRIVVAIGTLTGVVIDQVMWPAGHRHGETLLPAIERMLAGDAHPRTAIAGVIVGTGPGTFTGLRVGIATAKALAQALGRPIAGVATGEALLAAAADEAGRSPEGIVLLLPAGPADRVVVRAGRPAALLPAGEEPSMGPTDLLVALDLEGRAPEDAMERGEAARSRLADRSLAMGAARIAAGGDDLARLVPEYVTLPRGAAPAGGEVAWSRDPR